MLIAPATFGSWQTLVGASAFHRLLHPLQPLLSVSPGPAHRQPPAMDSPDSPLRGRRCTAHSSSAFATRCNHRLKTNFVKRKPHGGTGAARSEVSRGRGTAAGNGTAKAGSPCHDLSPLVQHQALFCIALCFANQGHLAQRQYLSKLAKQPAWKVA